MGWKSCMPCCWTRKNTMADSEEIIVDEEAEEVDEQYVFLEQFPTDRRVENPTVPFIGELPVPLDVGRVLDLKGEVQPDATRFSINLACGATPIADIAFHFNPRFDQNYIARNSRLSGHWGSEEKLSSQRNPFKRGSKFTITILAADEEFMVAVNGVHFCSYTYRTAQLRIQTVQINGDVVIETLEYHTTDRYPETFENMESSVVSITATCPLSDSLKDFHVLVLPLVSKLPTGFNVGCSMEIVGRTKLLPYSFYVNLLSDVFLWPHPEVYLHINPRFRAGSTVMNSWIRGTWGVEQINKLHFRSGRPFSLKIACKAEGFLVTVDGVSLGIYNHRGSPHLIKALYIQGDVYIKEVTIS